MRYRIIFLLLLFISVSNMSFSQTMTDNQVIDFVLEQQEKGVDQQTIATKLLQKGVTMQQLRRVRKKYQAQQEQMGAVDLTGEDKRQQRVRTRTRREEEGEQYQRRNNYMVDRTKINQRRVSRDDRLDEVNQGLEFFDIDSLLYYQNYFKDESEVFGRNIFNNQMLTFEPNVNMPTPANYRLGAGDQVFIDVWGSTQESYDETISPDGYVVLDGIGPVKLGGLTVSQATAALRSRLGRRYSDSNVSLSVGETRSIQVQVMGEVNAPGTYSLSSLSSAFNALYAAGGISDIGTLRDIKVYRGGREIASIDVYDYILNGNTKGDIRLQDNDVVVVGPYDCLVNIRGKVKRPMFYEMRKDESVNTIVQYAGGFTGDAYTKNVRLIRKNGSRYSIHTIEEFDMNGFNLSDCDSIYVDSVVARFSNLVEVRGAVYHPGQFELGSSISSVRDLIEAADGVREDAFLNRAVMHREKPDMTLETKSIDIKGLLDGTVADIPLRNNDVLFIPSMTEMNSDQTLTIEGEVNFPGVYAFSENTTLEDFVLQAGGLTQAASMAQVNVYRRIRDPKSTVNDTKLTETFSFALNDDFEIVGGDVFTLKPFDQVVIRKSPAYNEQQNVSVNGAVNFQGSYAMSNKRYRLSDLVRDAGGLSELAYPKGARLERRMTQEERNQRETTLRASQIQLYEESLRLSQGNNNMNLQLQDSLLNLKLDLGDTYPVAIDLEAALNDTAGYENIVLRENDRLVVPQYSNTVKISGEVMYPNSINYKQGESLSYYIKRAGGYGSNARKSRVYAVYMNGSVELIRHNRAKDIEPGCEIVVPSKETKNRMSTAEMLSIGSSSASIAAVVATIANLLK
ncbi:MAG: SLBB domain-containing protein [Bacteroidaceae bacterium]|nr:SLBB domain-containing protein [Bacteroidaceae bacterium]